MATTDSKIKKGRKYDQVLEGARAVFMEHGFEGASVDDIAKTAAVSKATLYSYFPDKRLLFAEVAKSECSRQAEKSLELVGDDALPGQVLHVAGRAMIDFFTSEFGLSMYRTCSAESRRFPELGQNFYQSGPLMVRQKLVEYFLEAIEKGQLEITDLNLAADQFAELCKASFFPSLLCGIQTSFSHKETEHVLNGAVDMFMARYGVKQD